MSGLASNALQWVFGTLIKNRDIFVRIGLAVSIIGVFLSLAKLVSSFIGRGYSEITSGVNSLAGQSLPDGLGCVMSNLGIDQFLTSAFAIFFSASSFWAFSVLSIMSYRGVIKMYKIKFGAHT